MKTLLPLTGLILWAAFALSSCATNEPKLHEDDLSVLPQNRPQSWEGSAALGSFFPGSN